MKRGKVSEKERVVVNRYAVRFQPWDDLWCLTGPVGACGRLLFKTARHAASHARWEARETGGVIEVFDPEGQPFKTLRVTGGADSLVNLAES